MKKQIKCCVGLIVASNMIAGLFSTVIAQETQGKKNYGMVKLGVFQPVGDIDEANFKTGFDVSVIYGRYLNEYLTVEAGLDIFGTGKELKGTTASTGRYTQDNVLTASALQVTLKGEYPVGPVDFFGGAGFGIYGVTLSSEIDTATFGSFDKEESDVVLGGQMVVGSNYDINESLYLALEGMYRFTDTVGINETVASLPVEYQGDLNGFSITVNAGIRF